MHARIVCDLFLIEFRVGDRVADEFAERRHLGAITLGRRGLEHCRLSRFHLSCVLTFLRRGDIHQLPRQS